MFLTVLICVITCVLMILGVLLMPKIKVFGCRFDSYWIVALAGALALLLSHQVSWNVAWSALIDDTAINPLKILTLFICMTILSIYLDELGFFSYLANKALLHAGASQVKLFVYLYLVVSVLTVFTSNDIIILSFTPFICYFAKNARIDAMPYLAAEFVAANTWSMALIIGNPTNIYLATANGVAFLPYLKVMILPTIVAGLLAFAILFLMYRKRFAMPISGEAVEMKISDPLRLWVGIAHLAVCTILLSVSSYLDIEMWAVSACSLASLALWSLVIAACRRTKPTALIASLRRAPWQLVPFVVSMFILTIALSEKGVTGVIGTFLGSRDTLLRYGVGSFLTANVINNIPMSVLFCSIMQSASPEVMMKAVYATTVGSNVGAFLTPVGALAGIMWSGILNHHGLKFGFTDFIKMGVLVAVPTLLVALLVLSLIL